MLCHTRPGSTRAEDRRSQLREDLPAIAARFFFFCFVFWLDVDPSTGRHRLKSSSFYKARFFLKISWMTANIYIDMGLNRGHMGPQMITRMGPQARRKEREREFVSE